MRNYYLHGKMTPSSFHLKATLLKKPPSGYYMIGEQIATSVHQALRMTIEQCGLHPPTGKETHFGVTAQSSFISR